VIFSPDLCELILSGAKTVTRRPVKVDSYDTLQFPLPCRYVVGRTYAVQPGRGKKAVGRIRVVSVDREPLTLVRHGNEWAREGFASVNDFYRRWTDLYGLVPAMQPVWRIEFELVLP